MEQQTYLMHSSRGRYKIGMSIDPVRRLVGVARDRPKELITLVAVCSDNIERELHRMFARFRQDGEWFSMEPAIRDEFAKRGAYLPMLRLKASNRPRYPQRILDRTRQLQRARGMAAAPKDALAWMAGDLIAAGWQCIEGGWRSPDDGAIEPLEQAWVKAVNARCEDYCNAPF